MGILWVLVDVFVGLINVEIVEILDIWLSLVSVILNCLEDGGLIECEFSVYDKCVVIVWLSDCGCEMVDYCV